MILPHQVKNTKMVHRQTKQGEYLSDRTTCSGCCQPFSSATVLKESASGRVLASMVSLTTILCPLCAVRHISSASSMVMQAVGMRLTPSW